MLVDALSVSLWAVAFQAVYRVDDNLDGRYYSYDEEDHGIGPGSTSQGSGGTDESSAGGVEDVEGCYLEEVCQQLFIVLDAIVCFAGGVG